jgi:hypothetical protein
VMNAANSVRCLLELSADELEETCDMCREHGDALLAGGGSIVPASPDLPIWVCIELNTLGKEANNFRFVTKRVILAPGHKRQKWSILYRLRAGVGSSLRLAAAVSFRESCG